MFFVNILKKKCYNNNMLIKINKINYLNKNIFRKYSILEKEKMYKIIFNIKISCKNLFYDVKALFLKKECVIFFLILLSNFKEVCKMHILILKRDGIVIYYRFVKDNYTLKLVLFYLIYFITRGCISLSVVPLDLKEEVIETTAESLTNAVTDHVLSNMNLEDNIVSIPTAKLEIKIAHDVNIYNIHNYDLQFDEIKVFFEKKTISINELVDYRFRYNYIHQIHLGYPINLSDREIIENVKLINEHTDIYKYFESNFDVNRGYYRKIYLYNANDAILKDLYNEYGLNSDNKKIKLINLLNENDSLIKKVDTRLDYILENKNKINNIRNVNENIYNRKCFLQKDIFNNEKEFVTEIKTIKVDINKNQPVKYKPCIIDECKYDDKLIKSRNKIFNKFLRNLK